MPSGKCHMKKLICAVIVLAVSSARADTIHVDAANCPGPGDGSVGDPYCSIQTAIDNAVNTDEIVVAPGTYFEIVDFLGLAITLRSSDGADVTTIDATGLDSTVVTCQNGEGAETLLDGFTITGGNASVGGMLNLDSSPTVTNCTFTGNTAGIGGGMATDSSPTVLNCTFSGNMATGEGGGIYNTGIGSPTVTGCTFTANTAGSAGGAMYNDFTASPTVSNCVFEGNTSGDEGGAIFLGATVTVTACRFTDNEGNLGGAIYNAASPTLVNCLFNGNSANFVGGAIYNEIGRNALRLTNCTLIQNSAVIAGGAIFNYDFNLPVVNNSILRSNTPDQIWDELSLTTVEYSSIAGGWPGTGNIDVDPLFLDPGNGDYRLSPGSLCIDAANNTAVPVGITTDLDGNPRFVDDPNTMDSGVSGNGHDEVVDMGAYEFQGASPCPWDCDGGENIDGTVGITDFLLLLAQWGGPGSCDFDGGGVGIVDFLALLANWGPCP